MTTGEMYTTFLLLTAERSSLRQALEGSHNLDGTVLGAPGPAPDSASLQTRAKAALQNLGINSSNLNPPVNLAMLFDPTGKNNVATDQARIALALALPHGGNCPNRTIEDLILAGLKQQMP